jgi:hypothetical protein
VSRAAMPFWPSWSNTATTSAPSISQRASTGAKGCADVLPQDPRLFHTRHTPTHTHRLSRLDGQYGRIRTDPRFLKLVRLAEAKLKALPVDLDAQAVGNIMNGE